MGGEINDGSEGHRGRTGPTFARWARRGLAGLGAASLALALWGCDAARIEKLEEGVATEADVRQQFGEPSAVYQEADGGRTLEFTRQPEGATNYMITIGADGRMSALRQVLRPDQFERIQPGMDKGQVRRLLGRPANARTYELQATEDWDWRFQTGGETRLFVVRFDRDGRVLSTAFEIDPRGTEAGGGR